jgi:sodium transport system permease protein
MSGMPLSWTSVVQSTLVIQVGIILAPALIMATMLTRSVRKALRLHRPRPVEMMAAASLAVCLHPIYMAFAAEVGKEYKLGEQTASMLMQFDSIISSTPIWQVLLMLALIPAICEELVFRGFLFAGLQRNGGQVRAILMTAALFGLSHGVLQQTITASVMGVMIGWIAYRSGGVACTIAFHATHNSISMMLAWYSNRGLNSPHYLSWAIEHSDGHLAYTSTWSALSAGIAITLIAWFATRGSVPSNPRSSIGLDDLHQQRVRYTA